MYEKNHSARQLFDSLSVGVTKGLVQQREPEHLRLDFKRCSQKASDNRSNLAKAISGFANSDGGVIVWGVDARKNAEGVNCASALVPIENVHRFRSELEEWTAKATDPPVDGVEHAVFADGGEAGFVATFVPPSLSTPHRAKYGDDHYFKRAGDRFYVMEHYDLEDMFGRRAKPQLSCDLVPLGQVQSYLDERKVNFMGDPLILYRTAAAFRLRNNGRGIAHYLLVDLRVEGPGTISDYGIDGNHGYVLPSRPREMGENTMRFGGTVDSILHMDSVLSVVRIKIADFHSQDQFNKDLTVNYRICADGVRPTEGKIIWSAPELAEMTKGVELPREMFQTRARR